MMYRQSRRVLMELRLRWTDEVIEEDKTVIPLGLWHPDTPRNRDRLAFAAYMGNRLFGPDTHWIEERQA